MAAWTPRDLANPNFVATQLSAKDRSYALNSVTRELGMAEPRLARLEEELKAADEASNNKPERRVVRELLAKAQDQTLSQAERDAAAAEAAKLQDERDRLAAASERALQQTLSAREYVSNLTVGQSNLLQAGAVPPGENMFAPPPGYEGRNAPAAQVPESQNPNPVPTTETPLPDNSVPTPVAGDATLAAEREVVNIEQQRQIETELGATQAEADIINAETQRQAEEQARANDAETFGSSSLKYTPPDITPEGDAALAAFQQAQADDAEAYGAGSLKYTPPDITPEGDAALAAFQQAQADDAEAYGAGSLRYTPPTVTDTGDEALAATQQAEQARADDAEMFGAARGTTNADLNTRSQATQDDSINAKAQTDWRVRLQLAPNANYLYRADNAGILEPLKYTQGVLFPYTPAISVGYSASYSPFELPYSNYKVYQYNSSSVDQITIACDFTSQDSREARYVLAVIHFFRSVTKMFYGQDKNPIRGTPPPLCYLTGMGQFQFDQHPLVITNFNMTLPTDVDYIKAANSSASPGVNRASANFKYNTNNVSENRLGSSTTPIKPGGVQAPPKFFFDASTIEATYVPTKMSMQITAYPIITRNDISNNFSLEKYATGDLLRGSKNKGRAGIW